jgi:hypothetical protein
LTSRGLAARLSPNIIHLGTVVSLPLLLVGLEFGWNGGCNPQSVRIARKEIKTSETNLGEEFGIGSLLKEMG